MWGEAIIQLEPMHIFGQPFTFHSSHWLCGSVSELALCIPVGEFQEIRSANHHIALIKGNVSVNKLKML